MGYLAGGLVMEVKLVQHGVRAWFGNVTQDCYTNWLGTFCKSAAATP